VSDGQSKGTQGKSGTSTHRSPKTPWLKEICLQNFLSFGPESSSISLGELNVLIGPNGSGKSNFVEALAILRATPVDIRLPFRDGAGVADWIYSGDGRESAHISAVLSMPRVSGSGRIVIGRTQMRYVLGFRERQQRLVIENEILERLVPSKSPITLFENTGKKIRAAREQERSLALEDIEIDGSLSVLSQVREPRTYPEITQVARQFGTIRLYRDWRFGPRSSIRTAQRPDEPNDFLAEDYSNLFLVLNKMEANAEVERKLLDRIRDLIPGVRRLRFNVEGGSILLYLVEGEFQIPATRLSDGTLRWLCLLAILLHPTPPPLVVIEEPELGIHPDLLPTLADLLVEASERMQLVITTHSDILIDALSDTPESILVAEKHEGQTTLARLSSEELKPWLEKYRLGSLWLEGHIGGKRW